MLKNSLFQPSLSFCVSTFSSFFCFSGCLFFLFCFGCPFFLSSAFPLLLFFFLPYLFKVQPFTCCSLTQPKKPKRFSAFQPKRFCFSSATLSSCFFLLYSFLVQPKNVTFSPKRFFSFLFFRLPFVFQPKRSSQNLFQLLHVSLFE